VILTKQLFIIFFSQTECSDVNFDHLISQLQVPGDDRSWTYQTCSEFGWYQTGDSPKQPISSYFNLDYFIEQCRRVFNLTGPQIESNVDQTNYLLGGQSIYTSNTVFTNGLNDPWHVPGVFNSSGNHGPNNVIAPILGGSHCSDMMPASNRDSASLKQVRAQQVAAIRNWLSL